MKLLGPAFLLILSFSHAYAKTLFISDIDDTIKNSHVLNTTDLILNSDKYDNLVMGMNVAYHGVHITHPRMKFYYVTNAPASLMQASHQQFLAVNHFPDGELRLRASLFQTDFKLTEIRKILNDENPDKVILVGDNGEKDIFVYEQIKFEYPQIQFFTYIHLLYSKQDPNYAGAELKPGQLGFVTSLDLFLQLRNEKFASEAVTGPFMDYFTTQFYKEDPIAADGTQAFPNWVDCRDYIWTADDGDFVTSRPYMAAKNRILDRCDALPPLF